MGIDESPLLPEPAEVEPFSSSLSSEVVDHRREFLSSVGKRREGHTPGGHFGVNFEGFPQDADPGPAGDHLHGLFEAHGPDVAPGSGVVAEDVDRNDWHVLCHVGLTSQATVYSIGDSVSARVEIIGMFLLEGLQGG